MVWFASDTPRKRQTYALVAICNYLCKSDIKEVLSYNNVDDCSFPNFFSLMHVTYALIILLKQVAWNVASLLGFHFIFLQVLSFITQYGLDQLALSRDYRC